MNEGAVKEHELIDGGHGGWGGYEEPSREKFI